MYINIGTLYTSIDKCIQIAILCIQYKKDVYKLMKTINLGVFQPQPAGYKAFIPASFPPRELFPFPGSLIKKTNEATRLLGKLDGITRLLPDADFFILMYLRKDAASSSQIEGTVATMVDAIEAEVKVSTSIPEDVDDIFHYLKALHHGIKRVSEEKFPVSLRLIRELHYQLIHSARVTHFSDPGEFRHTQNWIGGSKPDNARFVPPPPQEMMKGLGDLEQFIHARDEIPTLIKAGLLHAQFETLHPFLDGNGRTGRMIITIYLWHEGYLEKPVLFLSSYFKQQQQQYYDRLEGYHTGKVYEWLDFFLDGVIDISNNAIRIADQITLLRQRDMEKVQVLGKRTAENVVKILPRLYAQPIVNVNTIKEWTGYTRDGAHKLLSRLVDLGILVPKTMDKKYGQSFVYKQYLEIFVS
jgi:Fic family protein